MAKYADYKGNRYPVIIKNGFEELIELGGNKQYDTFVKEVEIDNIE